MTYELAPVKTVSEYVNVEVFEEREEAPGKVWYHIKTGSKILICFPSSRQLKK